MSAASPVAMMPSVDDGLDSRGRDVAATHLVTRVPRAAPNDTAASVRASLPGNAFDSVEAVYVVDEHGHLCGLVSMVELLELEDTRRLVEVMDASFPVLHPDEDQERIATAAIRHDVAAVPVVDNQGRFLGVVPAQALIEILRREHIEDIHRLAGILHEQNHAAEALEGSPTARLRHRLPWLLVGLVGSSVATAVMAFFENALQQRIAIAFFVPAIVYLADAIGTQTEAIVVRYLSLGHIPLRRLWFGEMKTGLLIGACLGLLIFPLVWIVFSDMRLAVAVSLAATAAGATASAVGLLFPWFLAWSGRDPAFGSGPVATIIQDVLSLLIYFGVVLAIV